MQNVYDQSSVPKQYYPHSGNSLAGCYEICYCFGHHYKYFEIGAYHCCVVVLKRWNQQCVANRYHGNGHEAGHGDSACLHADNQRANACIGEPSDLAPHYPQHGNSYAGHTEICYGLRHNLFHYFTCCVFRSLGWICWTVLNFGCLCCSWWCDCHGGGNWFFSWWCFFDLMKIV